jgi:hypothetical protein
MAEDTRNDHRVVELSGDGDEVGDKVERTRLTPAVSGEVSCMTNPNEDRERLADEAIGRDPDKGESSPAEPWAKTSSGDKEHITDDDQDHDDDVLDPPPLPGPDP